MQCGELDTMQLRDLSSLHIDIFPIINQFKLLTFNNLAMAMGYFFCEPFVFSREHPRLMGIKHMIRLDSVQIETIPQSAHPQGKEQIVSGL